MNLIIRNILAVIAGLVAGNLMNMAIILLSHYIVPPPVGVDMSSTEGLKAAIPLLKPIHYLMPFLAHAVGTLLGAFLVTKLAASFHKIMALVIGGLFLLGGIAASLMIPAPAWFIVLDLGLAYLPMSYLGFRMAGKK